MKVSVECYLRYEVGEFREFRCFLPIFLDDKYSTTVSANVIRHSMHPVRMANAVVDLSNDQIIKDRYKETEFEITFDDIPSFKAVPLIEYSELLEFVNRISQSKTETITEFKGEYQFLSNFHPAPFVYQDIVWPHSEAAYQAMKTTNRFMWPVFAAMTNPVDAKRAGKNVDMRLDWGSVRVGVMREIVREKFIQNPHLRAKLISTGTAVLEEGNNWKDTFWGVCPPGSANGRNELGKILMDLRRDLRLLDF